MRFMDVGAVKAPAIRRSKSCKRKQGDRYLRSLFTTGALAQYLTSASFSMEILLRRMRPAQER
jgi:hypothetical protein